MMAASLVRLLALLLCALAPLAAAQPPAADLQDGDARQAVRVVASIRPLALIANDLLGPLADVDVLVPGGASPHDYSLKVSDVRRLRAADLVVWMGPEMERFLEKPLAGLPSERVLSLGSRLDARDSGDHDHDLHQWLDPRLAKIMAKAVAARLQGLYPGLSEQIEARLEQQLASYDRLHHDVIEVLAPVRDVGFVVEHRGYDLFVNAFGLNQLGWLSATPEQPPGARHLYELEQRLRDSSARCLFMEYAHQSDGARNLARQLELRAQTLDILGHNAQSYEQLLRQLAHDVKDCLAQPASQQA
jgi:zinc transport system substrate-binding protein